VLEAGSVTGRAATRAVLAHGDVPRGVPLLRLFRAACQASFAPGNELQRAKVVDECEAFQKAGCDPMWPALARHLARIVIAEDRALLEDLARHPEKRHGHLAWGLQHYVRGDLVFDDGSVVSLEELGAPGLPPLPFVEAMPKELNSLPRDAG
jgi:hypothetical protein